MKVLSRDVDDAEHLLFLRLCFRSCYVLFTALALISCTTDEKRARGVSVSADQGTTLFHNLDSAASGVTFRNDLHPTEELNIITYLYYYNGGGVAVGDLTGDGLPDLYFGANQGPDALYINEGGMRFRENTRAAGLSTAADWTSGVSMPDVDGDGDLDLYVCKVSGVAGLTGRNELYLNDGAGHFTEVAAKWGLDFAGLSTQAAFFDADADGDLDAYLLNHSTHAIGRGRDASMRETRDYRNGDRFMSQGSDGCFSDATEGSGLYSSSLGYGLGVSVADFVGDALPDLYVANDFDERDYLYENLGGGRFTDRALLSNSSQFSMGNVAADLTNNGHLDLLTLDMRPYSDSVRKSSAGSNDLGSVRSRLRRGLGAQFSRNSLHTKFDDRFVDIAVAANIHSTDWSWAPVALDADLDGFADVVVGNGIVTRPNDLDYLKYSSGAAVQRGASNLELAALMPPGLMPNRAFRGRPNAPFQEVSGAWGLDYVGSTTAIVAADLDGDGDEDLVTNNVNARALIYENTTLDLERDEPRSLRIDLVRGETNQPAIGAKAVVSLPTGWRRGYCVQPVSGFQSGYIGPWVTGLPREGPDYRITVTDITGATATYERSDQSLKINVDTLVPAITTYGVVDAEYDPPSPYVYSAFDSAPLRPLLRNQSLESTAPFASEDVMTDFLSRAPEGVDTANVTALYSVNADEYIMSALWSPVLLVARDSNDAWRIQRALTSPGLWFGIVPVAGDDRQVILANLGLNTLLTEDLDQAIELHVADWDANGQLDPIAVRVEGDTHTTLLGLDPIAGQMPQMRKFFQRYLPFSASRFDRLFPPTERLGGRIYRASELRNYVLDVATMTSAPLSWNLQAATPMRASYDVKRDRFKVQLATPTLRPELMANNSYVVHVEKLTVHKPEANLPW